MLSIKRLTVTFLSHFITDQPGVRHNIITASSPVYCPGLLPVLSPVLPCPVLCGLTSSPIIVMAILIARTERERETTNSVLTRPAVRVAGGGGGGGGGGGTEIARSCWHRSDQRVNTSKDNTG